MSVLSRIAARWKNEGRVVDDYRGDVRFFPHAVAAELERFADDTV